MNTEHDPLKKFRYATSDAPPARAQPEAAQAAPPQPADGKVAYQAWDAGTHENRYLEIRRKFPWPSEGQSNIALSTVRRYRFGKGFALVYGNDMVVQVNGENLDDVCTSIMGWKAEYIQEFDPEENLPATDPKAPFIESIIIHSAQQRTAVTEEVAEAAAAPPPQHTRH